jgi:hypothetical protein
VTSSSPWIPVGALASEVRATFGLALDIARLLNRNLRFQPGTDASYACCRRRYNKFTTRLQLGEIAEDLVPRTDGPQMGLGEVEDGVLVG